jgi:hypothetical protein
MPFLPNSKSLTPNAGLLSIPKLASELVHMLAYKLAIDLSDDPINFEAFLEAEEIVTKLCGNLNGRLRTVPTNRLARLLNNLPTPELASVLALLLLADQSGVSDLSGERLQIITSFTSKLASLLPDEDLPPEASEYIGQLVYRPGTNNLSFEDMSKIALDTASMLSYKLHYVPTTQSSTPQTTTQSSTPH